MSDIVKDNTDKLYTGERFLPDLQDVQMHMEHFQRYLSVSNLTQDKVVADAACGDGYGTSILARNARRVFGIDIDSDTIQRAKEKYTDPNISFIEGSIENLPLEDQSIDVFISFETIEHVTEELQKKFLNEIFRVLKPEGILVISTPNKALYSDLYNYHNEFHIKEFYKEEFVAFLKNKFQNVKLYNQYFETVSIIDSYEDVANRASFFRETDKYSYDGKYFIAIAGNYELAEYSITSVYMNIRKDYESKIQRIIDLQKEVEERNEHLHELDQEIIIYRNRINALQSDLEIQENNSILLKDQIEKTIRVNDAEISQKNAEIIQKDADIRQIKEMINDKEIEINKLNKIIRDRDDIIKDKETMLSDLIRSNLIIPKNIIQLIKKIGKIPRKIYKKLFHQNKN